MDEQGVKNGWQRVRAFRRNLLLMNKMILLQKSEESQRITRIGTNMEKEFVAIRGNFFEFCKRLKITRTPS